MREILLVGIGGFVGSAARYYFGGLAFQLAGAPRFPVATLVVNISGCLLIGIVSSLAEHYHMFSPSLRLLLMTGVLGGFTTFSAFAYETGFLMRTGDNIGALANVALQVVGGLAAVWGGQLLVRCFTV